MTVLLLVVLVILALFSVTCAEYNTSNGVDFGFLNNAFIHLFENDSKVILKLTRLFEKAKLIPPTFEKSRYRRRCTGYMMCPKRESMYELENVIFYNDKVYLANLDKQSLADIAEMKTFYHGYNPPPGKEHLPGMFIFFKGFDWPLGPEIVTYTTDTIKSTGLPLGTDGKVACAKVWDTTAQFLFPWQPPNTFHGMNDNALYIITQALIQYVTSFDTDFSSSHSFMENTNEEELVQMIRHILPVSRSVFFFNQMPKFNGQKPSNGFRLLKLLYGAENLHTAKSIMSGGPHCVSHVSYGNGFKPFFRDGIVDLRNALYDLLQYAFQTLPSIQQSIHTLGPKIWGINSTSSMVPGADAAVGGSGVGVGASAVGDPYAQEARHNREAAARMRAHHEKVARTRVGVGAGGSPLSVAKAPKRKATADEVASAARGTHGYAGPAMRSQRPIPASLSTPVTVTVPAAAAAGRKGAYSRARGPQGVQRAPGSADSLVTVEAEQMQAIGPITTGTTATTATTVAATGTASSTSMTAVTAVPLVPNQHTTTEEAMAAATAARRANMHASRASGSHSITAVGGGARARMPGTGVSRALSILPGILTSSKSQPHQHHQQTKSSGGNKNGDHRPVRVVIMSRNWGVIKPHRNLDPSAEEAIKVGFEGVGAQVAICCSPTEGQTMEGMMAYMYETDICVGMHGAGLINCAYSSHKVTVVEIQHTFGRHFDGFMKGAHMTGGVYVNYDIRHIMHLKNDMYPLPEAGVNALVQLAMDIYWGLKNNNLQLKSIQHRYRLLLDEKHEQFKEHEQREEQDRNDDANASSVLSYLQPRQRQLSWKNPASSAFAVHSARPNMDVFYPPTAGVIDKKSVLGPRWEDTFKVCKALVYCEFPGTQRIVEEECDGWGFMWKRTNSVKTVLDPDFYNLERSKSLLFD